MSMIEDIKRDREAGTPGPWSKTVNSGEVATQDGTWVGRAVDAATGEGQANARRIARVPSMEAALLAAEELADAVDEWGAKGRTEATAAALNTALGNYRAATEGKQ